MMYIPDDDVLNVLNNNTNNNYNESSSDDELKILNENKPVIKDISLSPEEEQARIDGNNDFVGGVNHVSDAEINYQKQLSRRSSDTGETEPQSEPGVVSSSGDFSHVLDTGEINATADLAVDVQAEEKEEINTAALYRDTLGRTAYEDLKHACGLSKNASFTDYYNNTHYVPHGYEMEARMLLAEEKRMKLYVQYEKGEISKSDFLYQAYGKDLMKESGYDLSSKLFWYNRIKNGDYSNPLDSDTFLTDLISNSQALFEAETWYKEATSKKMSETLAGLTTGKRLDDDKVYKIFKTEFDALKPYFDNDIKKIITYYQAGSLGSAFSPFIDIDGDNKFDYYYHTDGKLYAVDDSSGTGASKCALVYNDDGSVHSVQVHEGIDGAVDSFWEGFRDFWVSATDLIAMTWNGTLGWTYGSFIDNQQKWEAWKHRTISDEDRVVFDSMTSWNGQDIGNEVAKGVGTLVGIVVLALITWGIGAAAGAAGAGASEGAAAGSELAGQLTSETAADAAKILAQKAAEQGFKEGSKEAMHFINAGLKQIAKSGIDTGIKTTVATAAKEMGFSAAKETIRAAGAKTLSVAGKVFGASSKMKSGAIGSSIIDTAWKKTATMSAKSMAARVWVKSAATAVELATKDFINTYANLSAKNRSLQYLEEYTGGKVTALSDEEIFKRAAIVAGADAIISGTLRATGDEGFTKRFGFKYSNLTAESVTKMYGELNAQNKQFFDNMMSRMRTLANVDSVFDIIENISTATINAVENNPYAKTAKEKWSTAWQSMVNPTSLLTNMYVLTRDLKSSVNIKGQVSNKSIFDERLSILLESFNTSDKKMNEVLTNLSKYVGSNSSLGADAQRSIDAAVKKIKGTLDSSTQKKIENNINAAKMMSGLFDDNLADDDPLFKAIGLEKEDVANIRQVIKLYNDSLPDGAEKMTFVEGMIFESAIRENDDKILNVYQGVLNAASELANKQNEMWGKLFNNSLLGKFPYLSTKAQAHGNIVKNMIDATTSKIGKGISDINISKAFLVNRFGILQEMDGTLKQEMMSYINNSDYFKQEVFDGSLVMKDVSFSISEDKDGKLKFEGSTNAEESWFLKLFKNPEQNKAAIQKLKNAGLIIPIETKDGITTYNVADNGAPWFGLIVNNANRNRILADSKNNPSFKLVFDTLDAVDYLFESQQELADSYNESLLVKVSIADPDNPNNDNSTTDMYIFGNGYNANLSEVADRLAATQSLLYNVYKLFVLSTQRDNLKPTEISEQILEATAKIGALMSEDKTMDPYYDFVKEYENAKSNGTLDKFLEDKLPKTMSFLLARSSFLDEGGPKSGMFSREMLWNLVKKSGQIPHDVIEKIAQQDDKEGFTGASKVAKEFLLYEKTIEDINKMDATFQNLKNVKGHKLNAQEQNDLKTLIQTINGNQKLKDALIKDGVLTGSLKLVIENPNDYTDFSGGFPTGGPVGTQRKTGPHSIYSGTDREERTRRLLNVLLDDDFQRYYVSNTRKLTDKLMEHFEKKYPDVNFKVMTKSDFIDFIFKDDETHTIVRHDENGNEYYEFSSGVGLAQNFIASKILDDDEATYEDLMYKIKNNDKDVMSELSVFLGYEKLDPNKFEEKNGLIYFNKKPLFVSETFKKIYEAESTREEQIEHAQEIIERTMSFYYDDTEEVSSRNIAVVNVLDILPEGFDRAFANFVQSESFKLKTGQHASTASDALMKDFKSVMGSSATDSQLRVYYKLLEASIESKSFFINFDLNNENDRADLGELLTSLGYDNDISMLEDHSENINGIYYKNKTTHNVTADISSEKIWRLVREKTYKNINYGSRITKLNQRDRLYGLFSSITLLNDDTLIKIKNNGKIILPNGISYKGIVDKDGNITYELGAGIGSRIYGQSGKGNLSGGLGESIYDIADPTLTTSIDSNNIDEKSRNTYIVKTLLSTIKNYFSQETKTEGFSIVVDNELAQKIKNWYNESGKNRNVNSVFLLQNDTPVDNRMYFKINDKLINDDLFVDRLLSSFKKDGFDINQVLPLWNCNLSNKTGGFESTKNISFESIYDYIIYNKVPGFSSFDDMIDNADLKIDGTDLYDCSSSAIESYKKALKGLGISEDGYIKAGDLVKLLKGTNYKQDNYYLNLLKFELLSAYSFSNRTQTELDKYKLTSLNKFMNVKVYEILGNILTHDYPLDASKIHDKEYLSNVLTKLKQDYASGIKFKDTEYTSEDFFASDWSASDASKFNVKNESLFDSINESDVETLLTVLVESPETLGTWISAGKPLPQGNNLITALCSFMEDHDGKLSIPMELFIKESKETRDAFFNFLEELKTNQEITDDEKINLQTLIDTLNSKVEDIIALNANRGLTDEQKNLKVKQVAEIISESQPSVSIDPEVGMLGRNERPEQIEKILELVTNRYYSNRTPDVLTKASSMNIRSGEAFDQLRTWLANALNITSFRKNDKAGSITTWNMDVDEAIGEAFTSIFSFSDAIESTFDEMGIKLDPSIRDKSIFELSLKAMLYSSGNTYAAEYGGALIIKIGKDVNGEQTFDVVPLSTSVSDEEKSIIAHLMFDDVLDLHRDKKGITFNTIENDDKNNYVLLKLSKNSFIDNVTGIDEKIGIYNLSDPETLQRIKINAFQRVLDDRHEQLSRGADYEKLYMDEVFNYYYPQLSTEDLYNHLASVCRSYGVEESVIEQLYNTVENLSVAQDTNLTEQIIYDQLGEMIDSLSNRFKDNRKFKDFKEAVIDGVTFSALKAKDIASIEQKKLDVDDEFDVHLRTKYFDDINNLSDESDSLTDSIKANKKEIRNLSRKINKEKDESKKQSLEKQLDELKNKQTELVNREESISKDLKNKKDYIAERKNNIDDVIDEYISPKSEEIKESAKEFFNKLDDYEKQYFVKKLLLTRLDGKDISAIMNSRTHTLDETFKAMNWDDLNTGWTSVHGNNVYNAVENGKHVIFDLEELYKNNKDIDNIIYSISFGVHDGIGQDGRKQDMQSLLNGFNGNRYCILVRDSIMNKGAINSDSIDSNEDSWLYEESKDTFDSYIKRINGEKIPDDGVQYIIVDSVEDAIDKFADIINELKDVNTIMAFNNKGKKSDDYYLGDRFYKKLNNIDNLDIRNDVLRKISSRFNEMDLKESIDYFRKTGKLSNSTNDKAHNSNQDIIDEYELYIKLTNERINTEGLYTELENEIADLYRMDKRSDEFKNAIKGIKFDNVELSEAGEKIANSIDVFSTDPNRFKRGNSVIAGMTNAYKILFAQTSSRAQTKADRDALRSDVMNAYNVKEYKIYENAIKNANNRKEFSKLLSTLISFSGKKTISELLLDNNSLRSAIEIASKSLYDAFDKFKYDYKNKPENKNSFKVQQMANGRMIKIFYSQPVSVIKEYLSKVAGEGLDSYAPTDNEYKSVIESKKLLGALKNKEVIDLYDAQNNYTDIKFKEQFADNIASILGINLNPNRVRSNDYTLSDLPEQFRIRLANSLLSMKGASERAISTLTKREESNRANRYRIIQTKSAYQKDMEDYLTNKMFGSELNQQLALWQMAHEKRSISEDGKYGTIYVGEKLLKKAYPTLTYTSEEGNNEFYTTVWRQPGQHKTPMQVLKVVVVDNDTLSMTTDTAKDYFNGDFDGDFYYFGFPGENANYFGNKLFEAQTIGGSMFDHIFFNTENKDLYGNVNNNAKRMAKYEGKVQEIFAQENVKNLFKAAILNPIQDNIDMLKKAYENNISIMFGAKSYDDLSASEKDLADRYWGKYGIRLFQSADFTEVIPLTANNLYRHDGSFTNYRDNNGKTINLVDKMLNDSTKYIKSNQFKTSYSDQFIGQYAKLLRGNIDENGNAVPVTGKASDVLFNSTYSATKENVLYIDAILESYKMNSGHGNTFRKDLISRIDSYIDDVNSKGFISDELVAHLKGITSLMSKDKSQLTALNLINIAQVLQEATMRSEKYNSLVVDVLGKTMTKQNDENRDKLKFLVNYMNKHGYNTGIDENDIDNANYGPAILQLTSQAFSAFQTQEEMMNSVKFNYSDNIAVKDLYNQIMMGHGKDMYSSRDNIEVITRNKRVSLGKNAIGLGKARIAVKVGDDSMVDSIGILDGGLQRYRASSLKMKNLSKAGRDGLYTLLQSAGKDGVFKGEVLNKNLRTNKYNETQTYRILGISNGINQRITKLSDISRDYIDNNTILVVGSYESLYNIAKNESLKAGIAGAKTAKGTIYASELDFKSLKNEDKKFKVPELVMSEALFNTKKASAALNAKQLGDVKLDGNLYHIYEVDDLALLGQYDLSDQEVKLRDMDEITIIQGSHGTAAGIAFGSMFLSLDPENKTITYDQSGYNNLRNILSISNKSIVQDVNGAKEVRIGRIAAYLKAIESINPMVAQEVVNEIAGYTYDSNSTTRKTLLSTLYRYGDLGGQFGANIEAKLFWYLSRLNGGLDTLRKEINKNGNTFTRVIFSKDVDSCLTNLYPTTALYDPSFEPAISKNWKPMTDAAFSRMNEVMKYEDSQRSLVGLEGGRLDSNTSYVPKSALVRLMLEDEGKFFNSTLVKDFYEEHPEYLLKGANAGFTGGYRFATLDQSQEIRPEEIQEGIAFRKTGEIKNAAVQKKMNPNLIINPMLTESVFKDNVGFGDNVNNFVGPEIGSMRSEQLDYKSKYIGLNLLHALPFLGDGNRDEIIDELNGFTTRFKNTLDIPTPRLSGSTTDDATDLVMDTNTILGGKGDNQYLENREGLTLQEQVEFNKKSTSDSKYMDLLNEKTELSRHSFDNMGFEKEIEILIQRDENYQETEQGKALSKLIEEYEATAGVPQFEDTTGGSLIKSIRNTIKESDIMIPMNLWSNENGIKLVNNWLKTWGFSAAGNKDISLGSETIRLKNKVNITKQDLLGDDYTMLMYVTKHNKSAYLELNEYMDGLKLIDAYSSLVIKEKENRAKLGNAYDRYLETTTNAIYEKLHIDKSVDINTAVEQLSNLLDKMYDGSSTLRFMVMYASRINSRLIEQAQKTNPFTVVGWFAKVNEPKDKKWLGHEYINIRTAYNEGFEDAIKQDLTSKPARSKLSSLLYDRDYGYIGMVEQIANSLSVDKTMSELSDYMKRNGWMRNIQVNTFTKKLIEDEVIAKMKSASEIADEELDAHNEETYNKLKYVLGYNGIDVSYLGKYQGIDSLISLYKLANQSNADICERYNVSSTGELEQVLYGVNGTINSNVVKSDIAKHNAYLSVLATMINVACDNTGTSTDEFYLNVYNKVNAMAHESGSVLVSDRGAIINPADKWIKTDKWGLFDIMLRSYPLVDSNEDEKKIHYAQKMLSGDIYLMDESVARQLDEKVYTQRINSKVNAALKRAKNLATSLVMSSPVQLLDRVVNFPIFDTGVMSSADMDTLRYMPTAIATVNKFLAAGNSLTDEQLMNDPNMKYLLRYLYATNADLINGETFRGESNKINIPGLRKYVQMANTLFNAGNAIPRFAYFMSLVKEAENNDFKLNRARTGVAFHMYDGISQIEGDPSRTELYDEYEMDAKKYASIDQQVAQIIAEHNGLEGNMPYLAQRLNNDYNTMFLSFPMALIRWGKNRIQSLGYAFASLPDKSSGSAQYLLRQAGSVIVSQALLLALQILLSTDTQNYLKKKIGNKEEDITDEEEDAAKNILMRGGAVKLFTTAMTGQETTTAAHSRGPVAALFDSYIADFVPYFNGNNRDFMKILGTKIKEKTWGHTNFAIKDVVESVPGNTWLQSTSWYEPGDNFFDNYGRKVLGYALGSTQANAFADYIKSSKETGADEDSMERLVNAYQYAFAKRYTNLKENKSEYRNYKKAFSIIYDYNSTFGSNNNYSSDNQTTGTNTTHFQDMKSELKRTLETHSTPDGVYAVIQKYIGKGVSWSTIKSALTSLSLKAKYENIKDKQAFLNTLSSSEKAVIKSAIIYEEDTYPFLDDIISDVATKARKEYNSKYNSYQKSISSLLKTFTYNTPKNYSSRYNSKYKTYLNANKYLKFLDNYVNSVAYKNKYNNQSSPLDAYDKMKQIQNYGTSTDVWGNETRHYTDGTEYSVRQQGMPFPGGNK